AENAGVTIREVVTAINKATQLVQDIAAACAEQNEGATQIRKAINELDVVTQQNSAFSEESASSSEELAEQAFRLQEAVALFNIGDSRSGSNGRGVHSSSRTPVKSMLPAVKQNNTRHESETDFDREIEMDEVTVNGGHAEKKSNGHQSDAEFKRF
ncbi:MAG: hypothetical protein GC154_12925, partial [bacterium]|nr:hypothetical protein [bacterium]